VTRSHENVRKAAHLYKSRDRWGICLLVVAIADGTGIVGRWALHRSHVGERSLCVPEACRGSLCARRWADTMTRT